MALRVKLVSVAFLAFDAILVSVLARIWFSQQGPVRAMHLCTVAIGFQVFYDTYNLLSADSTKTARTAWDESWVIMFVILALAMSRPSIATNDLQASGGTMNVNVAQTGTLALSLAVPSALVLWFGALGQPVPWLIVGLGGLLMAVLVGFRVALLLRSVQEQTHRAQTLAGPIR